MLWVLALICFPILRAVPKLGCAILLLIVAAALASS